MRREISIITTIFCINHPRTNCVNLACCQWWWGGRAAAYLINHRAGVPARRAWLSGSNCVITLSQEFGCQPVNPTPHTSHFSIWGNFMVKTNSGGKNCRELEGILSVFVSQLSREILVRRVMTSTPCVKNTIFMARRYEAYCRIKSYGKVFNFFQLCFISWGAYLIISYPG